MKKMTLEPLYLLLSLILLGFSGFVYITYGKQTAPSSSVTANLTTETSNSTSTSSEEKIDYSQLQSKIDVASQNPNAETINGLKAEVQALKDSAEKTQFLETLSNLELDITTIAGIQENLTLAETTAIADYFSAAQTGIDSLNSEHQKSELQNRLNTLYTNLTGVEWTRQ